MNKFWEWMRNNRRLSTHVLSTTDKIIIHLNGVIYKYDDHRDYETQLPKQMLIGYMIEYLYKEHGIYYHDIFKSGASSDKYEDYIFKKIKTKIERVSE